MEPILDASRCPLCGEQNNCPLVTPAASPEQCWCVTADIPAALLAEVPVDLRDLACICQRCVERFRAEQSATPPTQAIRASVGLIQINVTDVKQARAFYADTLGFPLHPDSEQLGLPMLDVGGTAPVLLYPAQHTVAVDYPNQTGVTLVFHVENIDATVADWRARNVELIPIAWSDNESGIASCPFGRFIAFRDPFGNVHEILQPQS